MRIAALDVGDRRVGVAVSDELGMTARGIGTVHRVGGQHDLDAIGRLLADWQPLGRLVVGLPINMDGTEGKQAARVRAFGARVAAHLALEVAFHDERLTSWEADERLKAAGIPLARRKALLDQEAAAIILESYLAQAA
jgi:putative Holliday junction resolvase